MTFRLFAVLALWLAVAGPDAAVAATLDFDDARRGEQWYLDAMNFPQAWGLVAGLSERAVIKSAVLDSGFDREHEELQKNTFLGYNIVAGQKGVFAANPHGTATLGTMAAQSGNGTGVTGAAITSNVLPVQITNRADGAARTSDMVKAIIYAVDRGARVINLSYTGVHLSSIAAAAKYAKQHGAVVFMAAGNDGEEHAAWQNYNWVVAVGSIDPDGAVSSFSSRGSFVDFVAPGRAILTTEPGDEYGKWTGTSLASPLAASVATLMLSANPNLSSGQVIKILRATAIDVGPPGVDTASGYGLIDAEAAVAMAIETPGKWSEAKLARATKWTYADLANIAGAEMSAALVEPIGVIPEPGSLSLLLLAAAGLRRSRRRWPA